MEIGHIWKKSEKPLDGKQFQNCVEPGRSHIHVPQVLSDPPPTPGLQLSRAGGGSPSPGTQLRSHPLGEAFSLPLEKLAAVSNANAPLFKVPERNWSKLRLGETSGPPELMLTFHDGDVNSSSPGPGDTAQPWAVGYGGTAAAGNHPSSEVKEHC